MYQGAKWILLKQKKRSRKSHAWAPLSLFRICLSRRIRSQKAKRLGCETGAQGEMFHRRKNQRSKSSSDSLFKADPDPQHRYLSKYCEILLTFSCRYEPIKKNLFSVWLEQEDLEHSKVGAIINWEKGRVGTIDRFNTLNFKNSCRDNPFIRGSDY